MLFEFFPPEINSTLMYAGPGSSALMAASTAWQELSTDLASTATSFQGIVSGLTGGSWTGPSSQTMAASVAPYVGWLNTTAEQAAQSGAQATAAAGAYETAYSTTIPPMAVFLNRAQLLMLIATNLLGQNTAAIAANEAQYAGYWATDATAMDTYWAASTQTAALPQIATPAAATNMAAQAAQPAATAGSGIDALLPDLETILQSYFATSPTLTGTELSNVLTDLGITNVASSTLNSIATALIPAAGAGLGSTASLLPLQALYYGVMMASMPARMLMSMGSSMGNGGAGGLTGAGGTTLLNNVAEMVDGKMQAIVGSVSNQLHTWGTTVSAQLGRASSLGTLSVPNSWQAATGTLTRAAPILPNTSVTAPPLSAPSAGGIPGGPFGHALMGALSGKGLASMSGKAPKVVPKSPAAG
ncbi:MAG: PPE family protein [Mycobacterium sp.]